MIGVGLSIPQIAGASSALNPLTLFAAGEQGVWYDPSDLTTLFQDSAGVTPVTAVEQPVGLVLDKSKGLALGPELITNGTFDTDVSGWSGGTASWSAGTLRGVGGGVGSAFYSAGFAVTAGQTYKFTFTIKGDATYTLLQFGMRRTSSTGVFISNTASPTITTSYTTISVYIVPTATVADAVFFCRFSGTEAINIDNVSVKLISGNHASQATTTSRPTLSAKVNELLNSRLNGGVSGTPGTAPTSWAYSTTGVPTVTFATDTEAGSGNSVRVTLGTSERQQFRQTVTVSANTTYTISAIVDVIVVSGVWNFVSWVAPPSGATVVYQVDGVTVAGGSAAPLGRHTISAVLTVAATAGTASAQFGAGIQGATTGQDAIFRQVQVQSGSVRTAYQWTNTATDYDTGFPLYLKFDGTDDSLATPSIDFSATDKMTVHAGVRKVSDAAQAMVVELSSSLGTNNGTFALQAPRTTSAGRFSFVAKGTGSGTVDADAAANASPVTAVLTSQMDIAGDATSLRVNGVSAGTSVADLGTGNLGNYPLYIGRRGGSTLPFNGRLYSLIVRGAASTNAQIVGAEKWVNGKTGAY